MSFANWLSDCLGFRYAARRVDARRVPGRQRPSRQRTHRPSVECLEDRLAPATLTVNTLADNTTDTSVLTLRDAIVLVDNSGDPTSLGQSSMPRGWSSQINGGFGSNDTVQFASNMFGSTLATITLGGSELLINH